MVSKEEKKNGWAIDARVVVKRSNERNVADNCIGSHGDQKSFLNPCLKIEE
jgi:hypothetical protein